MATDEAGVELGTGELPGPLEPARRWRCGGRGGGACDALLVAGTEGMRKASNSRRIASARCCWASIGAAPAFTRAANVSAPFEAPGGDGAILVLMLFA